MKKPGQPDSALEITAGRRSLLRLLNAGVADGEQMSMAANWIRDLTVHHGESVAHLHTSALYNHLMSRSATTHVMQDAAATWIARLLMTGSEQPNLTPNEQRAALGFLPIKEHELMTKDYHDQPSGADDDDKAHGDPIHPANSRQVGGSHYARAIQHWDFAASNGYDYLLGQVTKYLFRWRDKNGLQDVEKAAHFLQKAGEIFTSDVATISIGVFLDQNNITGDERTLFLMIHAYHDTNDPVFLIEAQRLMENVLVLAGGAPKPPQA